MAEGLEAIFLEGRREHQAGRLDAAEAAYRRVLDAMPQEAEALHLLGLAKYRSENRRRHGHWDGSTAKLTGGSPR
jgi:hypothetical protein